MQNPALSTCFHDPKTQCLQGGDISWDNKIDQYLHLRFDGCICTTEPIKRCDCIIFRFPVSGNKPFMYAIEVKQGNPNLAEVQAKIQYCVDRMMNIVSNCSSSFRIIPVLCASAFHGLNARAFFGYRIAIGGKKVTIRKRLHKESINDL